MFDCVLGIPEKESLAPPPPDITRNRLKKDGFIFPRVVPFTLTQELSFDLFTTPARQLRSTHLVSQQGKIKIKMMFIFFLVVFF